MTNTQAAEAQDKIAAFRNELAQYVGMRQADHYFWLAEQSLESMCVKRDGASWVRQIIRSLEQTLTTPTHTRLVQTSPETESWGGFLSQDISYVPGPSLRAQFVNLEIDK